MEYLSMALIPGRLDKDALLNPQRIDQIKKYISFL